MRYEFIGKPDKLFPHLVTEVEYDLKIEVVNGLPKIVSPIVCPYSSWTAFHRNWRYFRTPTSSYYVTRGRLSARKPRLTVKNVVEARNSLIKALADRDAYLGKSGKTIHVPKLSGFDYAITNSKQKILEGVLVFLLALILTEIVILLIVSLNLIFKI